MLDAILTGAATGFTFVLGYFFGRRRLRSMTKDLSICSCDHKYSMHNDNGSCNVHKTRTINGIQRQVKCACNRYDGVPPAHLFMKDI